MDTSAFIISIATIIHFLGIILIIINSVYMACTRGQDSALGHGKRFSCKPRNFKRMHKIRFDKTWNLFVMYHILIMGVICEEFDSLNYQTDSLNALVNTFWISAIISYGVVFLMLISYIVAL